MVTPEPDVQYVVCMKDDTELTVVRSQETVVIVLPPGKRVSGGLVFDHGQAFQLGRALCELSFFDDDGMPR